MSSSERQKLIDDLIARLPDLSDKDPNDVETQLGIALLYDKYGPPEEPISETERKNEIFKKGRALYYHDRLLVYRKKISAQYDRLFALDPSNPVGLAYRVYRVTRQCTASRQMYLADYDKMIANAKNFKMEEMKVASDCALSYLLTEKDEGVKKGMGIRLKRGFRKNTYPIIITDFDLARRALVKKLDAEVPAVIEILEKGEKADPDNALYNYLRAHLYFVLDEKDKAFREVKEGVNKRYLNNYVKERIEVRKQVALKSGFSNDVTEKILSGSHVFADFLLRDLCYAYIYKYAEQYKQQGELEEAQEKYAMLIGIANHIREEPVPTESRRELNNNAALGLEEKAVSAIREISQNSEK